MSLPASLPRRALPDAPARRGWCPGLSRPMPTGDGLLARVHPPLGILTLPQARAVAAGARRFGNGHLDLTARANLQVRGVSEETRVPLARLLEAAGLGDARADGGPQRLTLTSPLAGLDPAETFDVPGLARAIEAAGRTVPGLPPKTLVAVEGRVGAWAAEADVCVAALGPDRVGIAVASEDGPQQLRICAAHEVPAAVAALLAAFARTGRRRARDLTEVDRETLVASLPPPSAGEGGPRVSEGRERGSATVQNEAIVAPSPDAALPSPDPLAGATLPRRGGRESGSRDEIIACPAPGLSEPAPGFVVLALDAPFGRCTADALDRLIAVAGRLGAGGIRLSPARGFVLIPAQGADAAAHLPALGLDFIVAPDDPRRSIAACTGAPACASGTTPTLADAARLADSFRPLAALGLSAHVSGCAKGCARPGPAALTLVGRDGFYGAVIGGGPSEEPAMHLPIEAALERIGRAATVGLAAAFAPDDAAAGRGRDGRPA